MKAYVDDLKHADRQGAAGQARATEAYDAASRRTAARQWTIAAFVRQGRIYEVLAKGVLNTPFVVPADMKKQMAMLPDYAREDVRVQVEDTVRQVLDQQTRPIECFAVVRYALAARAAKVGSIDNEYTQQAITASAPTATSASRNASPKRRSQGLVARKPTSRASSRAHRAAPCCRCRPACRRRAWRNPADEEPT